MKISKIILLVLVVKPCLLFAQGYGGAPAGGYGGAPTGEYGMPSSGWSTPSAGGWGSSGYSNQDWSSDGWGTSSTDGWGSPSNSGRGSWGTYGYPSYGYPSYGNPYSPYQYGMPAAPVAPKAPYPSEEKVSPSFDSFGETRITGTDQYFPKILTSESRKWETPSFDTFNNFNEGCPGCMVIPRGPDSTAPTPVTEVEDPNKGCPYCMQIPGGVPMGVPPGPGGTPAPSLAQPATTPAYLDTGKYIASVKTNECSIPSYLKELGVSLYKEIVITLSDQPDKLEEFKNGIPHNCPSQLLKYLILEKRSIG